MNVDAPVTLGGALVLGLGGSLHCFAMCGPLACAAQGGAPGSRRTRALLYQGARVVAYATVGAILGGAGGGAGRVLSLPVERALPWVLAVTLLTVAIGLPPSLRALRPPAALSAILAEARRLHAKISPNAQALLLGAITPLLPCGLLYGIGLVAVTSGSAAAGALVMGGFALAALPALVAAQWGVLRVGNVLKTDSFRRALAALAALALIVRATEAALRHACH